MKTISNEYKEQLRALGKEIDSIITIGETELTSEQINSANLHYEGNILKSVMKQLDLVLVDPLEKNTELNYKFGIKVNDEYEYIDYGNFIVYQCDKLEDTNTYQIKCYDKMLYSMTDYKNLNITYPITIKNYLQAICTKLGLTLKDDTFANQDREIQQELYLDSDGNSLGYKFRDVLDEIAQATGSTICINDNDELEVRYINEAIKESESLSGTSFELESEEAPLNIDQFEGETTQETTILPSEYTQVEYIESTGTQYINTGFKSNSNTRVVLDFLDKGTSTSFIFGARDNYAVDSYVQLCVSAYKYRCDYGSNQPQIDKENNVRYVVDKNKNITTLYKNGTQVAQTTSQTQTFNANLNMYLFALNNMDAVHPNKAYIQLYSCKIYDNGTLVRDYIPCYRNSDNVIGLYDLVNNVFYTNSGTGTFVKGANVNLPNPDYPQEVLNVTGLQSIDLVGKNLFDVSTVVNKKIYNGAISDNASWRLGDYIPIKGNQDYTLSWTSDSNFFQARVSYFDKYKNYISQTQYAEYIPTPYTKTFTTPSNAQFIRLNYSIAVSGSPVSRENIQVELGNRQTSYEPYKDKTYDINLGKNLINYNDFTSQGTITITNETISVKNNTASTIGGLSLVLTNKLQKGTYTFKNYVDSNGTIYVMLSSSDYTHLINANSTFTFDYDGTSYLRLLTPNISAGDTKTYKLQLEKGSQATPYSNYFTPIELCKIGTYQDKIFKGKGYNLLSSEWEQGSINSTTGVNEADTITSVRRSADYIKVEPNTTYTITRTISGNTMPIRQYGINHEYIGSQSPMTNYLATYTTPNNVYYIRFVDWVNNNSNEIMLVKGSYTQSTIPTYEPYNAKDKWYLHKEVGKYIANNDLTSNGATETSINLLTPILNVDKSASASYLSVRTKCNLMATMLTSATNNTGLNGTTSSGHIRVNISKDYASDYATARTFLTNKGLTIYYVLATPTNTEITNDNYPELYSQLKAIDKARTLDGLTYIDSSVPISFEYIKEYETIDEELVKNTRASFEDVYGPINSIVLSRSADSDNVYLQDEQSIGENGLHELKISDNQILNGNDRSDYLPELLDRLDGLMYNLNDYESIGITYLDLCDRYKVSLRGNKYTCIMFNDEIEVNNGLNEIIYTEMPQETETDYSKADKTDRKINQTTLIVDKQQGIIESLVEKVVDVSNTISGTGSITLEKAHAGNLHYLSIKGNISQLFPNNNIKPSNTRLPIGPTLLIDSTEYTLDIDRLRYINNTICDEFVYQDGECYIIRRVDSNGNALANEVIEPREGIILQVEESSTISLKSFNNAIFKCEYLLENVYTDNFASQVDVKSSITQTENMIAEKVEAVADEDGNVTSGSIILAINKDESQAGIQADKIKLEGYTTINDGFSVDLEGNMKAKSGDVGGWKINESGLDNGNQFIHNNGYSNIYTYADMVTIRNYLLGNIDLTQNDISHYDLNNDGVVDLADYVLMRKMILGDDTEGDDN